MLRCWPPRHEEVRLQDPLHWFVDELSAYRGRLHLRGWVCHDERAVTGLRLTFPGLPAQAVAGYGLPSPDVAEQHGERASAARFAIAADLPEGANADEARLLIDLDDGTTRELLDLYGPAIDVDPYQELERSFWRMLDDMAGGDVLEVGSRDRSGTLRRSRLAERFSYTGLDLLDGANVDVVGDAHDLRRHFRRRSFDAVIALSVFEHLLMPWKAVLEINRVLRPGGLLWIATHQTFPLHEVPWDYWRYSDTAWQGLLNRATGFDIVTTAMGEPATVVPRFTHSVTRGTEHGQAHLGSSVIARKVATSRLRWPVALRDVVRDGYPVPD